jgi:hypothetical protein
VSEIDVAVVDPLDELANRHHRAEVCRSGHLGASVWAALIG